ncbi:unnamed protein product [Musa acuminata subsp. burmannicoides]
MKTTSVRDRHGDEEGHQSIVRPSHKLPSSPSYGAASPTTACLGAPDGGSSHVSAMGASVTSSATTTTLPKGYSIVHAVPLSLSLLLALVDSKPVSSFSMQGNGKRVPHAMAKAAPCFPPPLLMPVTILHRSLAQNSSSQLHIDAPSPFN